MKLEESAMCNFNIVGFQKWPDQYFYSLLNKNSHTYRKCCNIDITSTDEESLKFSMYKLSLRLAFIS